MGENYVIVNPSKQQYLNIDSLGENSKWHGVVTGTCGRSLHAMAIAWLVCREVEVNGSGSFDDIIGSWSGDSIWIAGDEPVDPHSTLLFNTAVQSYEDITIKVVAGLCEKSRDLGQTLVQWSVQDGELVNIPLFVTLHRAVIEHNCLGIDLALRDCLGKDWRERIEQLLDVL